MPVAVKVVMAPRTIMVLLVLLSGSRVMTVSLMMKTITSLAALAVLQAHP